MHKFKPLVLLPTYVRTVCYNCMHLLKILMLILIQIHLLDIRISSLDQNLFDRQVTWIFNCSIGISLWNLRKQKIFVTCLIKWNWQNWWDYKPSNVIIITSMRERTGYVVVLVSFKGWISWLFVWTNKYEQILKETGS